MPRPHHPHHPRGPHHRHPHHPPPHGGRHPHPPGGPHPHPPHPPGCGRGRWGRFHHPPAPARGGHPPPPPPWHFGGPPGPWGHPPPPPPCEPEAGDHCCCNSTSPVPAPESASSGEKELSPLGSSGLHPSSPGVSVSGSSKASAATRVNAAESSGIQGTGGSDSTIQNEFLCPITMEIMKDPVIAADGFTYERSAITQWLDSGTITSPMTNVPLPHANLLPNRTLKMLIQRHLDQGGQ